MRNIIGYSRKILLLLFSSLFFCLSFFSVLEDLYAQSYSVQPKAELYYYIEGEDLRARYEVTLTSISQYPSYVHYFTVNLPFSGISDIEVMYNGKKTYFNTYYYDKYTQVVPDFSGIVVKSDLSQSFTLNFLVEDYTGLEDNNVKLVNIPAKFATDIDVTKVTLSYESNLGELKYLSVAHDSTKTNGTNIEISFDNPTYTSISALIGSDIVYNFNINETYENNDENKRIVEVNIPVTNSYQRIVINSISPSPFKTSIDDSNNIIAFYEISPGDSKNIKMDIDVIYSANDLLSIDVPKLTSSNEFWRVNSEILSQYQLFKTNLNADNEVASIYSFILSTFSQDLENTNIRLGAQSAFDKKVDLSDKDYVDATIALLRANNVPARMVEGFVFTKEQNVYKHTWLEYYNNDEGWAILDPFLDDNSSDDLYNYTFYDHIAIVNRENNPLSPNILYSSTSTCEVTMKSFSSDSDLDILVDFQSEIINNVSKEIPVNVLITNNGNAVISELYLEIEDQVIDLLGEGYVLIPGQVIEKRISLELNEEIGDIEYRISFSDLLGNEEDFVDKFDVVYNGYWWWNYLVEIIGLTVFSLVISAIYFIFYKVKNAKK